MKEALRFLLIGLVLLLTNSAEACTRAPVPVPLTIAEFSASPPKISAGQSATLRWSVSGATTVSIDRGIGNVALTGSRAVTPIATTIYTLTATNEAGMSTTATTQVAVTSQTATNIPATNIPTINYFTADPSNIALGDSITLRWSVSNATSIYIDNGIGAVCPTGSIVFLPSGTTTYALNATNSAGERAEYATVQVSGGGAPSPLSGLPVINYFTADPPIITAGSSTTLSWDVSNATSVTIDPGVGSVDLTGTALVSPMTSTNYTLTASNLGVSYSLIITVLVTGGEADATPPQSTSLALR
jgi:hypothetical protein